MEKTRLSDSTVRLLRGICLFAGAILILAAVFANALGLSMSGGLSRNQIAMGSFGLALILAAFLGRRFPSFYRGAALLLLNTVILLLLVDLASLAVLKVLDFDRLRIEQRKMEEGNLDLVRNNLVLGRYAPYVVWRADPATAGEGMTVSADGHRITPGNPRGTDAFTVFFFGGSSMWGTGVADTCTIPFHFRNLFQEYSDRPVRVINFGQVAFSSTQEVIELVLQLRNDSIPDLVVFYDGFNDIWGAYENGFAGGHHAQSRIAERIEGRAEGMQQTSVFRLLLMSTNTWLLLKSLEAPPPANVGFDPSDLIPSGTMSIGLDSLAEDVVHTYMGNCRVVEALGEAYGFDCLFVWQSSIWIGEKPLTEHESDVYEGGSESFQSGGDPAFKALLMGSVYAVYEDSTGSLGNYGTLAGLFDQEEEELYTDYSGCHVNSRGNLLIAEELVGSIRELRTRADSI